VKRGGQYPALRARWVMGREWGAHQCPPCWVSPEFLAAFLFEDEIGNFIPEFVDQGDLRIMQWEYVANASAVIWSSVWDTEHGHGELILGQQNSPTTSTQSSVDLRFNVTGPIHHVTWWSADDYVPGNWLPAFLDNRGAVHFFDQDFPWIFFDWSGCVPVFYKTLRDFGEDDHDTAPVSWNATV